MHGNSHKSTGGFSLPRCRTPCRRLQPSAATVVALDPGVTAGVGAQLDFAEYEAENGATNGRIVGPDRTFTTLASQASANALTVRYALPDGPEGKPVDARLGVYAESRRITELAVTSRYCCYYGHYPFRQRHPFRGPGNRHRGAGRANMQRLSAGMEGIKQRG